MNEQEELAFRTVYQFLSKYRETILETDEQWLAYGKDVGRVCGELNGNRLGQFLLGAVIEYINVLYKNGMKPLPENYFGRNDM